jgi:hypothetical protein
VSSIATDQIQLVVTYAHPVLTEWCELGRSSASAILCDSSFDHVAICLSSLIYGETMFLIERCRLTHGVLAIYRECVTDN